LFSTRPEPIAPRPGQESVWDYPRPPRLEPVTARLVVVLGNDTIAETTRGYRVLETSHPPNYYFPPNDVAPGALERSAHGTLCYVDGEPVTPQPGGFYGGWVTSSVVGPFKGGPGSRGW
jgi:uncharacterized protein (DUF427 family)